MGRKKKNPMGRYQMGLFPTHHLSLNFQTGRAGEEVGKKSPFPIATECFCGLVVVRWICHPKVRVGIPLQTDTMNHCVIPVSGEFTRDWSRPTQSSPGSRTNEEQLCIAATTDTSLGSLAPNQATRNSNCWCQAEGYRNGRSVPAQIR